MTNSTSSSTLRTCRVTITSILYTKCPIPVLFTCITITTENPLIVWLIETSCVCITCHQRTISLCQLSLCQSSSIILTSQCCTCINSVGSINIRNPTLGCWTHHTTLSEECNSILTVLINLSVSLSKRRSLQFTRRSVKAQWQSLRSTIVTILPTITIVMY